MERKSAEGSVIRNYKDTLFRMIFSDRKQLLSLYNAVNGTAYDDPELLEIVTLENAVYLNMKNDLAFIMDFQMYLYEHQSTYNPNIPLRDLFYVAREYEKLIDKKTLYGSKLRKIPTPSFIVFYNGTEIQPERKVFRLSDAFEKPVEEPNLELKVQMLNINASNNAKLMEECKMLHDYSLYVEKIRAYAMKHPLQEAVEMAVNECIENDILEDFLRRNRAEAIHMSIFEYDEEKEMKLIRQDEREVGRMLMLQEIVEKKLRKGKSIEMIAEELEQSIETIQQVFKEMK